VARERSEARDVVRLFTTDKGARAFLSSAPMLDSPILLLDEPTECLDEAEAQAFLGTLAERGRTLCKTVVLATRRLGLARAICDRIVMLDRGQLFLDRRTSDPCWPKLTDVYRITVGGQLDAEWSEWFEGMRLDLSGIGTTALIGPVPDQSALHGLLVKVRDLGLPLLALSRVEPDARDVLDLWRRSGSRFDGAERPNHNGRLG
jgi:hypothetical protein